jgi:hypothetical protein
VGLGDEVLENNFELMITGFLFVKRQMEKKSIVCCDVLYYHLGVWVLIVEVGVWRDVKLEDLNGRLRSFFPLSRQTEKCEQDGRALAAAWVCCW